MKKLRVTVQKEHDVYNYRLYDMETNEEIAGVHAARLYAIQGKRPELHLELDYFELEILEETTLPPAEQSHKK